MRHEMIISYEIVDGQKTAMRNEGELIRCMNCKRLIQSARGSFCMGRRKSPMGHCDEGKKREDGD